MARMQEPADSEHPMLGSFDIGIRLGQLIEQCADSEAQRRNITAGECLGRILFRVGILATEVKSAFCGFGRSKSLKTLVPGAKINLSQVTLNIKIDGDCIFWVHWTILDSYDVINGT